jgi:hypothetical protein
MDINAGGTADGTPVDLYYCNGWGFWRHPG